MFDTLIACWHLACDGPMQHRSCRSHGYGKEVVGGRSACEVVRITQALQWAEVVAGFVAYVSGEPTTSYMGRKWEIRLVCGSA
ncbi:MAG: hypothetical protein Nkreftii_001296 [Candidatus Nitrospira kreftii]|uniref:Uncharacterized protein n=1 Tax=Candidatus Nitrospira kreftii TaxID=2652173 RepID=A0A7S8FCX2_9BACT|nr:MAG: hypothetical protein Nkreftii_001296 [Candidatus Nitrospira kreftii]